MTSQIWATLNDTRFKGYCLHILVQRFQRLDRAINIFLAIASSGSIAAWAIWNSYPMVWGTIIALSQVVTAIKPFFPYYKYVKELNSKCLRIESLNIELEKLWYKLQKDKISDDEASEAYFDIRAQCNEVFNFADETILEVSKAIENKANQKMKVFLKSNYNIVINI